jgi:hypothetical protein
VPIFIAVAVFIAVSIPSRIQSLTASPCHVRILQVTSVVSSSYDALFDLFECLGSFIKRLGIYSYLSWPTSTRDGDQQDEKGRIPLNLLSQPSKLSKVYSVSPSVSLKRESLMLRREIRKESTWGK